MAWQLIYTSAPRLLAAGRSGFGSVARHRQISPLLVSAIERASQFSRQPGMDPGRVIFSYRIIPISGGRFHVLSCIRDSGADYTGRTNHIAHHIIAEAREIAQLRSQGPSPADVLLAIPWIARWDGPPRFLEPDEELDLADYAPQTGADGAHWASVTGNPAHAWLLAAGEASRGAYLIPPPGVDLRWLIADSLRLTPERLWQTSFTTSLQSKDEISDYRWVGLESDSPLRSETAASGRPILDLRHPESLPLSEVPTTQIADASKRMGDSLKIKIPMGVASEGALNPMENLPSRAEPARQDSARRALDQQTRNQQQHIQKNEGVRPPAWTWFQVPNWAWITVAVVLVAACVGILAIKPSIEQLNARKKVASALEPSAFGQQPGAFFGDESARMKIAQHLLPKLDAIEQALSASWFVERLAGLRTTSNLEKSKAFKDALSSAQAAGRLAEYLDDANFDKMKSTQSAADITSLSPPNAQVPDKIREARALVNEALRLYGPPNGMKQAQDISSLARVMDARRNEISEFIESFKNEAALNDPEKQNVSTNLAKELNVQAYRNQAKALLSLIDTHLPLLDGYDRFEKAVHEISDNSSDQDVSETVKEIGKRIDERRKNKASAAANQTDQSSSTTRSDTFSDAGTSNHAAAPTPRKIEKPPLYLTKTANIQKGNKLSVEQLRPGLKFSVKYLPSGSEQEYKGYGGSETDFGDHGEAFKIAGKTMTFRTDHPKGEFELTARSKESGEEVFVVHVFGSEPVFPHPGKGIELRGDSLVVSAIDNLPGRISGLQLALPEEPYLNAPKSLALSNSSADFSIYKKILEKEKTELQEKVNKEETPAEEVNLEPFEQIIRPHLSANSVKKTEDKGASAVKQCGLFLHAIGTDWPDWIGSNVTVKADTIHDAGNPLARLKNDPSPADATLAIKKAIGVVDTAIKDFEESDGKAKRDGGSGDPKKRGVPVLTVLKAMKQMLQEVEKNTPAEKEKREQALKSEDDRAVKALKALDRNPLLNGKCPPGTYTINGTDAVDGTVVRVMEIHVE